MASIWKRKSDRNKPGTPWYITYAVKPHEYKRVVGLPDYELTRQIAAKLENDVMLRKRGILDPAAEKYAAHAATPIAEHVTAYKTYLESKRNSAQHVHETKGLIEKTIAECSWKSIADIDGPKFASVLKDIVTAGASSRTANKRRLAVRGWSRWLHREARLRADPLAGVAAIRERDDRRRVRRTLEDAEALALLAAAERGPVRGCLTGPDRAMFYLTALGTGFRVSELLSLTPESFDLKARTVTLQARSSKRRLADVQPIRADLCEILGPWLARRPAGARLWKSNKDNTGRMIAADLKDAGINPADDGRGVLDCHALRHTFVTRLGRAGVSPKVMQSLARHSTITLTMDRYAHLALNDPAAALDTLPALAAAQTESTAILAATGTDHAQPAYPAEHKPEHKQEHKTPGSTGENPARRGTSDGIAGRIDHHAQTRPKQALGTAKHGRSMLSTSPAGVAELADAPDSKSVNNPEFPSGESTDSESRAQARAQASVKIDPPEALADPDLEAVVRAWPDLPATARQCIGLMVAGALAKRGR